MDRDDLKLYLRDYVESITERSKGGNYVCPLCGSGKGVHHTGAFSIDSKDPTRWKCFACDESGDLFDLIGKYEHISEYPEQEKRAREIMGDTTINRKPVKTEPQKEEDFTSYFRECMKRISAPVAEKYLEKRGISKETAERFHIGYDPVFKKSVTMPWQALIIPTGKGNYIARNINSDDPDDKVRKVGASLLFNTEAVKETKKPIFIAEGEIDALSIEEVGGVCIGLGGVGNIRKLLSLFKGNKLEVPVVLALDNDDPGRKATEELSKGLEALGISYIQADIYGEYKDANEALVKDRYTLTQEVIQAEKEAQKEIRDQEEAERAEYMLNSTSNYIDEFTSHIFNNYNTEVIPTGFKKLDASLDGGLYPGLYILGAISSLGKSTLILQIADQIAQQGRDVLIISLEMSRYELMSKSISRHTFLDVIENKGRVQDAKTARGITTGSRYEKYNPQELELIDRAISTYRKYTDHLFIYEGVGDIGVKEVVEKVEKHKKATGNTPVVIIDYLQILAPADVRATDKQNTDKNVLELKRLSRDSNIPVIGISSFNRQSYREAVSEGAFKESGAIEYGSDVLIGLQFEGAEKGNVDLTERKRENPRKIELVVLKNRNGKAGEKVPFNFYPMFNLFEEDK